MTTSQREKSTLPAFGGVVPLEKRILTPQKLKPKKIVLLAGPTAVGKSQLALSLAKRLKGEIISADSMQVYRGMDIGTAKVSEEDQAQVPHHLIDLRYIHEPFNVVDFYYEARQCIDSILARDRVPLIVGGSGFYFRALLYGPPCGPPSIPEVREQLEAELDEKGEEALYAKLQILDPTYAATITPKDRQKIVRALEIIALTGEPVSALEWDRSHILPDFDYHCWFLHRPRSVLYPRIDARCDQMLDGGLLDEVKALDTQGLRSNPSASQAIGYRQCLAYLDTSQTPQDYETLVRTFKTASRHYAKRQFTWFRKEPLFRWLDIELHDNEIALDMIAQEFLSST